MECGVRRSINPGSGQRSIRILPLLWGCRRPAGQLGSDRTTVDQSLNVRAVRSRKDRRANALYPISSRHADFYVLAWPPPGVNLQHECVVSFSNYQPTRNCLLHTVIRYLFAIRESAVGYLEFLEVGGSI
jgi:hypothetical protein